MDYQSKNARFVFVGCKKGKGEFGLWAVNQNLIVNEECGMTIEIHPQFTSIDIFNGYYPLMTSVAHQLPCQGHFLGHQRCQQTLDSRL